MKAHTLNRRLLLAALAAAAGALALVRPAAAQAPIVIKFSHVVAIDTPKGKASEFFAKRAAELTKGKVKVEVYANSTLYKDKEEMEALQLGAVQMLAPSLAKFGPLGVKEFEVFDLPFIFDNSAELHKVTQGPVGQQLLARLEAKGIRGLAFWDSGYTTFMSTDNPERNYLPGSGTKGLAPFKNSVGVGTRLYLRQIVLPLLGLDVGYGLEARDVQVYLAIGLTD